jgi:outer membrane protein, heavy metal efflux system
MRLRLTWLALALAAPVTAQAQERLGIEDAVRLALERSAEVRSAEADVGAARIRRDDAGRLLAANPELEGAWGARRDGGGSQPEYGAAIAQPVEVGGQRGLRIEGARSALAAAEASLRARRAAIAAEARLRFGAALAAAERTAIESDGVRISEAALAGEDERRRAGAGTLLELNAARVELGRARRSLAEAIAEETAARAALLAAIGGDAASPLELEGSLDALGAPATAPPPPVTALLAHARAARADLAAARASAIEARAAERLAGRGAIPTPSLGASWSREEGATIVQGVVRVPLPLFDRNRPARADAAARATRDDAAVLALERELTQEVVAAHAALVAAGAVLDAAGGEALTAAAENLELATEGHRAGRVRWTELIAARREALEAQRAHVDARAGLHAARVRLAAVLGEEDAASAAVRGR